MSHVFQLSDEQYAKLVAYAAQRKQTPETLFQTWLSEVTHNVEAFTSSSRTERLGRGGQQGWEEEPLNSPLSQILGIFSIDAPDLADKHDEYLAEAYMENHADNQ